LDGNVHIVPLLSTFDLPTPQPHSITSSEINLSANRVKGVSLKGGVNGQVTNVIPGYRIGYHRTNSVDYNIMVKGSAYLITPNPEVGGGQERTLVNAGEIVIQRGTIHAWEAGEEGARWVTVVIDALPAEKDEKVFEEVEFQ